MKTKKEEEKITSLIIGFLTKNPIEKFLKLSEPCAIAYEKFLLATQKTFSYEEFSKLFNEISLKHFTKVFNKVNILIDNLPPKLTSKNVHLVVDSIPRMHKHGLVQEEVNFIIKRYKVDKRKFNTAMGINTVMIIDGQTIYYDRDIETALKCALENRTKSVLEFD